MKKILGRFFIRMHLISQYGKFGEHYYMVVLKCSGASPWGALAVSYL